MKKQINIIIADDSRVSTALLCALFQTTPDIHVIACARDGLEAVTLTKRLKPDLVTMDIFMPQIDGVQATREIMEQCPTPIIMISAHANETESPHVFNALQAGALSVIEKPQGVLDIGFDEVKRHIIHAVRTLAQVQVVPRQIQQRLKPAAKIFMHNQRGAKIIALGSSTGGPEALRCILSSLPGNFPIPIVITQHITKGFLPGLVTWLQTVTPLTLAIATQHQPLMPGCVYFAAEDAHLVIKKGLTPLATLDYTAPIDHFRPSISAMFSSLAMSYPGLSIGGLLTGMGQDGASGLLQMKKTGCLTFAQSKVTSVIYGMPAAAVALQATDESVDLEEIPQFLAILLSRRRNLS